MDWIWAIFLLPWKSFLKHTVPHRLLLLNSTHFDLKFAKDHKVTIFSRECKIVVCPNLWKITGDKSATSYSKILGPSLVSWILTVFHVSWLKAITLFLDSEIFITTLVCGYWLLHYFILDGQGNAPSNSQGSAGTTEGMYSTFIPCF